MSLIPDPATQATVSGIPSPFTGWRMRFTLPVLNLLTASLLLALAARPYAVMSPELCESRADVIDKTWRLYAGAEPRDDELFGEIYLAQHEGFVRECLIAHSCRAFRRALDWNRITDQIPADDPAYLKRVFGMARHSCGF